MRSFARATTRKETRPLVPRRRSEWRSTVGSSSSCSAFSFFQAEDGIRDLTVTGVQTCALPIFRLEQLDQLEHENVRTSGSVLQLSSRRCRLLGAVSPGAQQPGTGHRPSLGLVSHTCL